MSIYDYLEFRHLRFILTIADEGSMTKAADRLGVVQSNLSKQISEIEDLFHVRLFDRVRSGVQLTPAGHSFYNFAHQLLDLREEAVNSLQALHDAANRPLRLGFSQFIEHAVLQAVSQAYRELFPKGSVEIEGDDTEAILRRLERGDLDAALITLPFATDGLSSQSLLHERMVVCLRKDDPLAQKQQLRAEDLNDKLGIFSDPQRHPGAHKRLLEMLQEQAIRPRNVSPAFNLEQIQWLVEERVCLALIRENEVLHETLTTRSIDGVRWTIDSAIVFRQKDKHGALALLLRDLSRRFPDAEVEMRRKQPRSVSDDVTLFGPARDLKKKA